MAGFPTSPTSATTCTPRRPSSSSPSRRGPTCAPGTRPSVRAYRDARLDRAISYQSLVQDLNQMKGCLASGYPFIFGFTVYQSFEAKTVARSGHAPMPMWGERPIGGHAVMAVGYDDA